MPPRKRSRPSGDSGAPAGKKSRVSRSRSLFGQLMEGCGMKLGGLEQHNKLTTEPALVQRRLGMDLKSEQAVREFCEGLSEYCSEPLTFRMALLPSKVCDGANISVRSCGLDSVVRILLGVDCLQPVIVNMLLTRLPQYLDGQQGSMSTVDFKQMPTLILNQLKMLDHLVEGKEFCSKLLEVVGVAPPEVRSEIVTALPDIVDDPQHDDAALLLKSLLSDAPELTAAIMDALFNLVISKDIAADILDVAMERLQTSDVTDLPTIIRFIMQYVTAKNAQEVISELRSKLTLDLSPLHSNVVSSTPLSRSTHRRLPAELSSHFVVFDTIAATIHLHKAAADGWMKAIEAVEESADHRVIDILVLFFLHSIGSRRKSVEALVGAKVKAGCFSDDLLSVVLGSHAQALTEYFLSVLSLCDSLLCSPSPTVSTFAASLYRHLFAAFDIPYQQEVVGALVQHISNGSASEVDHALSTLLDLVHQHFPTMSRFSILIKGILDQLEYLTTPQIRQLYDILTVLGFTDPDRESAIQDEMRILIRKQLSHSEQRYRHMGVIGAVMCVKQLSSGSDPDQVVSQGVLSTTCKKLAESMLDEVMKTCGGSVDSMILFCEEMVGVVSCLHSDTLAHLSEQVTSSFQDDYLIEASDLLPSGVELLYALDPVEDGAIALNILPLVRGEGCEGVRALAARFHLLRVCERALNGSLEGIDALLGCPVALMPEGGVEPRLLEDLPLEQRQEVCLSLFHTINWFRELVCAFSAEQDVDMKGKVLLRLGNITHLQDLLERALSATLGWWPPSVNSWEPTHKPRKGKSKNEVTLASITMATINPDNDAHTTVTEKPSTVHIDRVKPYFRPLSVGVVRALGFGVLSRTFLDSEDHTRVRDELRLHPPQTVFLLEDLHSKVSTAFSMFGGKVKGVQGGHFHGDDLVKMMPSLFPVLCDQLESICGFLQAQINDADGMVDMDCSHEHYPHHCLSLHLLLRSLATFLAWPPLTDPMHRGTLSACVEVLAQRRQATPTGPTLPHLATDACKYLEGLLDVLPTLSCAHAMGKLLVALCKSSKATQIRPVIAQVCGELLCRGWRLTEQTSLKKEAIEYLLKYHLEWAEDPLLIIEKISGESAVELIEGTQDASTHYPTLTKNSFPWFYRVMMYTLVHQVKIIPVPKRSDTPTSEELDERFHTLEVSAKVLFILVSLVKSFCKSAVLSSCLKNGRTFVDSFLKCGMPVLNSLFRARKDDVLAVLKSIQQSTRLLQHYCGHSKVVKDTRLINNVPPLKKSLELFIFKVKELLSDHSCGEAFWLGNLKNRDIKGQEILSQQPNNEEPEESEDEDAQSVANSTSTDRTVADELVDQEDD